MSARPPCPSPADCWGWITPEEVIRIALSAYHAACREVQPPPDEPWLIDGDSFADRECFRDELLFAMERRVHESAIAAGLGPPHSVAGNLPMYPEHHA